MLDLQGVVVDDDALDDQPQDDLSFGDVGGLQPGADALGKRGQAGERLSGLEPLRA